MTSEPAALLSTALLCTARAWIADDPDPATRAELSALVDEVSSGEGAPHTGLTALVDDGTAAGAALVELADRMAGPLRFGTAGLRGPVRAGPNGMNVAVVRRTTAGLAGWLIGQGLAGGAVVVGRDARHGSAAFAGAAAAVLGAAGFDVRTLPGPLPTPLLAFAVRALPAVAGVQITASHNPAGDNGYKVYLGFGEHGGAQLVAPADIEIEAAIAAAPPAAAIPVAEGAAAVYDPVPDYLDRLAGLPRPDRHRAGSPRAGSDSPGAGSPRHLRIALTPLHGVGGAVAVRALRAAGFTDVHLVAEQAEPDPDFRTVAAPNPEDPRATEALLALAAEVGADLAIALDPDADRCAVGVPDPTGRGGWRMLTGDQVGALLGEHVLATTDRPDPLVASTVVSSSLLAKVAAAHGARHAETLTGFKWIVRAGSGLVYGYEEAIGYCVDPDGVRDKDGISAAVLVAGLAAARKAAGGSLTAALDELAVRHGVHATSARQWTMTPEQITEALERVAGSGPVERPAPDLLILRAPGERVAVRPSGTEPKLKAYLEVVEAVRGPDGLAAATERAQRRLAMLGGHVTTLIGGRSSPPC